MAEEKNNSLCQDHSNRIIVVEERMKYIMEQTQKYSEKLSKLDVKIDDIRLSLDTVFKEMLASYITKTELELQILKIKTEFESKIEPINYFVKTQKKVYWTVATALLVQLVTFVTFIIPKLINLL
jgi:hypothetical protein